jgi:hypothetical protein
MAGQRRQDEAGAEALDERRQGTAPVGITFVDLGCACGCAVYSAGWRPPERPDDSVARGACRAWSDRRRRDRLSLTSGSRNRPWSYRPSLDTPKRPALR